MVDQGVDTTLPRPSRLLQAAYACIANDPSQLAAWKELEGASMHWGACYLQASLCA